MHVTLEEGVQQREPGQRRPVLGRATLPRVPDLLQLLAVVRPEVLDLELATVDVEAVESHGGDEGSERVLPERLALVMGVVRLPEAGPLAVQGYELEDELVAPTANRGGCGRHGAAQGATRLRSTKPRGAIANVLRTHTRATQSFRVRALAREPPFLHLHITHTTVMHNLTLHFYNQTY